jgi:hypothetical protein
MGNSIGYVSEFGSRLEDVNKYLKTVADRNTQILSMFMNMKEPVHAIKAEWVDKTLVGFKDTLAAAVTSTTQTTITLNSGTNNPKRYIPGVTLVEMGDEVMLVSSIITTVTNTTSLNVTRSQFSTTAATYVNGRQAIIIGNPRDEGFSAGRNDSQQGVRAYNMTQIFERQIKLSGSTQEVATVGLDSIIEKQVDELSTEILKELQHCMFYGRRFDGGADFTGRRMGGMKWFCLNNGGNNNQDKGGNGISFNMIDDVIEEYLFRGGDANKLCMFVSVKQQRKLNDLKEARVIGGGMSQDQEVVNNFISRYDFGSKAQVEVILSTDLRNDEVFFAQKDFLSIHSLGKRALQVKILPEDGDFTRRLVFGEYSLVARNARETLFRLHNLSE